MRTRLILAALAAAATVCAGVPDVAGADHRHHRCFPKSSRTLAMSDRARVYERYSGQEDASVTQVCAFRTGRRVVLGRSYDLDVTYEVRLVRFAKGRVAVAWRRSTDFPSSSEGIDVVDLRAHERRPITELFSEGIITDVELKPNGSLAWIQEASQPFYEPDPPNRRVFKQDASGQQELDSGTGIAPDSLALSGSWLYWTSDGQPRVATLD